MDGKITQISQILHEAGSTHGTVYKIVNGADDDWASWYSEWLINLSPLSKVLGLKPVRSELTYLLVKLDKEYTEKKPEEKWQDYYAKEILKYFSK